MILTPSQQSRFWREWAVACQVQGWTTQDGLSQAEIDAKRHLLLSSAGFRSLTQVDRRKGFDRVLEKLAMLRDDLDGLVKVSGSGRRVILHAIAEDATFLGRRECQVSSAPYNCGYLGALLSDRFGHMDLDRISEAPLAPTPTNPSGKSLLEQVRDTLHARAAMHRRRARSASLDSEEGCSPAASEMPASAVQAGAEAADLVI